MPLMPVETRGPSILAQLADTFVEGEARNKDAMNKVMYANKQSRTMADIAGSYREGIANAKTIGDVLNLGSNTISQIMQVDSPAGDKFAQHITQDMGIRARMMGTTPNTFEEALLSGKIDEATYQRYSAMKPSNVTMIYDKDGNLISAPKNNIPAGAKAVSTKNAETAQGAVAGRQDKTVKEANEKQARDQLAKDTAALFDLDSEIEETKLANEATDKKAGEKLGTYTNLLNAKLKQKAAIEKRIAYTQKTFKWDAEGNPVAGQPAVAPNLGKGF